MSAFGLRQLVAALGQCGFVRNGGRSCPHLPTTAGKPAPPQSGDESPQSKEHP